MTDGKVDKGEVTVSVRSSINRAQKLAQKRARQVEAEARHAIAILFERVAARMEKFLVASRPRTREQWAKLGGELVKIGQKLQELAMTPPPQGQAAVPAPAPQSSVEAH